MEDLSVYGGLTAPLATHSSRELYKHQFHRRMTLQQDGAQVVALEAVLRTDAFNLRPPREPEYRAENRALLALARAVVDSPQTILQALTEKIAEVLGADSAGVSLLTDDGKTFYWPAVTGVWEPHLGGGGPRDFGPCGDVLDCNAPLLFAHPERRYTYLSSSSPAAIECLVVPFHVDGEAVGTIWAIMHDDARTFDGEDLRQLTSLGAFAAAAYQAHKKVVADQLRSTQALLEAVQSGQAMKALYAELRESRDGLHRSESNLRELVENVAIALHWLGPDGEILWANQTAFNMLGYSYDEYIGQNIVDLHEDDADIADMLPQLLNGKILRGHEARLRTKDGSLRHVLINFDTLFENGVFVHTRCFTRDISDRQSAGHALRESEAFHRSIIESSPNDIQVLDLDGTLRALLRGKEPLRTDDLAPSIGCSWFDTWAGDDRRAAEEAVARARAGGTGSFVGFYRTLRGDLKRWDVAVSPILDTIGKPSRLLAVSRDLSHRKRTELNLAFLASVTQDLPSLMSVDDMMQIVSERLSAYLNLSQCTFAEIDETAKEVVIVHDWHRADVPGVARAYPLDDFVGPRFIQLARAGEVIVVCDTVTDPRTDASTFASPKFASFICAPLIVDGVWRFALCLYQSVAYAWRDDEIEIARELVRRVWERLQRIRTDEVLRESEARYRTLFSSIDEGFCVIEMIFDEHERAVDYRFLEMNPTFERQTGMRDVVGKLISELVPDLERQWFEMYGRVALTGEPVRVIDEVRGLGRWLDIYACRFGPPEGRKVAVVFSDITERRKAEDALRLSEERFRALFDRGPIAMYSCDTTGVIRQFNPSAVELWGKRPQSGETDEEFCGAFKFFLPSGERVLYRDTLMSQVLRGELASANNSEIIIERLDGVRLTVITNIVPFFDDRSVVTGAMNCFYDITERSRLERKTQEQAAALGDLDRRKDEFLAMLSHELRNPLAPIFNAVHILRLNKNEDPVQQQARGIIERQVGQLKHLVDDLLEISRVTTGRVQLRQERVLVCGIVERAIETAQPLIKQRLHELTVTQPSHDVWLFADAARMEQVIVNLLTNAAKYTDEGGQITLTIVQEGDTVSLRVCDSGIGIAPELLPHVFDLFTQADRSLDRSQGGLGIGLCLVQRLVELHGGTVKAFSELGKGSEFVISLPVAPITEIAPPHEVIDTAEIPVARRRVLIVDDNVDTAQSLALLLLASGHDVRMAHDGPTAVDAALNFCPDLALLDIGLPGFDGYTAAQRMREQKSLSQTVLVAVTGYGQAQDRERSLAMGFDHHLVKPVNFDEVQKILMSSAVVTP